MLAARLKFKKQKRRPLQPPCAVVFRSIMDLAEAAVRSVAGSPKALVPWLEAQAAACSNYRSVAMARLRYWCPGSERNCRSLSWCQRTNWCWYRWTWIHCPSRSGQSLKRRSPWCRLRLCLSHPFRPCHYERNPRSRSKSLRSMQISSYLTPCFCQQTPEELVCPVAAIHLHATNFTRYGQYSR